MSIRIDPETGLKVFATRAAKASHKIAGKGYSEIEDKALKTLPPQRPGTVFNAEEQARYREFKEARRGAADYMAMEGEFSRYLDDVTDDVTFPTPGKPSSGASCDVVTFLPGGEEANENEGPSGSEP